jgi:hypothetical protein
MRADWEATLAVPTREQLAAWRAGRIAAADLVLGRVPGPTQQEPARDAQPGADGLDPDSLPASPAESLPGPSESLPGVSRVVRALGAGPLSGREVALRSELRWRTAFLTLAELEDAGRVAREGRGRSSRFRLTVGTARP